MVPPKVLVVDDSPASRLSITSLLQELGARVSLATDGAEALRLSRGSRFDLIIADVEMPELNGFDLCERLKNSPSTLRIRRFIR